MPAYGKVKVDTITYDLSGTATDVSVSNIATKASPTFTGTVTVPTPSADDNSTKAASTAYVQTELGDYALKAAPTFTGTVNAADLVLSGDLTVNGSTTTIDTTTLQVEDKNVVIGKVSTPSDATADGGGWTLKGATDKTFNWVNATDAWTSSEHIHLGDDKKLLIGTGSDLQIYHDASNSFIKDSGTGNLFIDASITYLRNAAGDEHLANFNSDGAVNLYHNGVLKVATSSSGATVSGTLAATAVTGDGSGLTNLPPGGNTFTAVAEGAIANNKAVQIRTDGKVEQIAATTQVTTTPNIAQNGIAQGGTGSSYHDFGAGHYDNMAYDPESDMTLVIWKNTNDTQLYYKMYEVNNTYPNEINAARTNAPDAITGTDFACCSLSNRRFAVCYEDGSKMKIQIGQVAADGSNWTWGSAYYIDGQSGTAGDYREPHMVAIGDDRIAFYARANNSACKWNTNTPGFLVGDVTSTNVWNYRSWSAVDGIHDCDGQWRDITYDSTNDIIAFVWRRDSTDTNAYIMGARVSSGTSPTFTLGTPSVNSSGKVKDRVRYNSAKNIFVSAWEDSGDFYMRAHTINSTTLAVTSGTAVYWNHGTGFSGGLDLTISTEGGAFGMAVDSGGAARLVSATFAGTNNLTTTINGTSNRQTSSNYGSLNQGSCVYVADVGKILTVTRSGSGSSSAMILGTNDTTSQVSNFANNEFFVGYADQAYTNGQTATIKTYGNNVDTLSGLTVGSKYYVQGDGTVGTSADVPVARAGIAIAANKLLIQEPTNWGG